MIGLAKTPIEDGANVSCANGRVTATLLKALNNPFRREALRLLHESPEPLSAMMMTTTVKDTGNLLAHHLKVLAEFDVVTLVDSRKVRGLTENLYASQVNENVKVKEILVDTRDDDAHVRRRLPGNVRA